MKDFEECSEKVWHLETQAEMWELKVELCKSIILLLAGGPAFMWLDVTGSSTGYRDAFDFYLAGTVFFGIFAVPALYQIRKEWKWLKEKLRRAGYAR